MDTTNSFEKISLSFKARDLPKMDTFSHTDSFLVVNLVHPKTGAIQRIGNTNVVKNTENPDWPEQIVLNYMFEETQLLKIQIYDQDTPDLNNLKIQDSIGEVSFTLAKLMCSSNQAITANVTGIETFINIYLSNHDLQLCNIFKQCNA